MLDTTEESLADAIESADEAAFVKALDIRLVVDNGLPIDVGMQIFWLDSSYQIVDQLFESPEYVFSSAPVNHSASPEDPNFGRPVGLTRTLVEVSIPRERIEPLKRVAYMAVAVFGNTTTNGTAPIRLFSENEIHTSLAAKISLSYEDL